MFLARATIGVHHFCSDAPHFWSLRHVLLGLKMKIAMAYKHKERIMQKKDDEFLKTFG